MQHAWKHVERPGGSHTALDGKKKILRFRQWPVKDNGISPPSLWIIVGRPACISARIATALFSHKVRSHSSRALCARVSVCGGAFRAAVVPNALRKGLSGEMGDGRC